MWLNNNSGLFLRIKKCQAVKTGMLGNEETVCLVAKVIKKNRLKNVVVDPVVFASSGKRLLTQGGVEALKKHLLPLASLVTPNIKEAELLSGIKIKNPSDRKKSRSRNFKNRCARCFDHRWASEGKSRRFLIG